MTTDFTCRSCGASDFEQVVVTMPSGMLRQTDLFCCRSCRTVYFEPSIFSAGRPACVASMRPDFKTYSG